MNFEQRSVMVIGAAGKLGNAVTATFAERGARLVLVDPHAALATAIERFRRIDPLCNLAGGFRLGEAVHETADRTRHLLFDLNARTLLHGSRRGPGPARARRRQDRRRRRLCSAAGQWRG